MHQYKRARACKNSNHLWSFKKITDISNHNQAAVSSGQLSVGEEVLRPNLRKRATEAGLSQADASNGSSWNQQSWRRRWWLSPRPRPPAFQVPPSPPSWPPWATQPWGPCGLPRKMGGQVVDSQKESLPWPRRIVSEKVRNQSRLVTSFFLFHYR